MASERFQRRIERLLDQIEEAMDQLDWESVREYARAVLRLDPENNDALSYLAAAERDTGSSCSSKPCTTPNFGSYRRPAYLLC